MNTKSSTDVELVGFSDVFPKVIFVQLFLEAQGCPLVENFIYQDDQSAIRLEVNGKKSFSKRSRHVRIHYLYVKDLVEKDLVRIKFYPTNKILAHFFAKPL